MRQDEVGALGGVRVVTGLPRSDDRGSFMRLLGLREHSSWWGNRPVVQVNLSRTTGVGTVRGLHYQRPPDAEAKLVRCIRGRVFDVGVDLRPDSPSFLTWFGVELSSDEGSGIFLPEGFAHGFQVLEADSELIYLHSGDYSPQHEGGVRWDDPLVSIEWPLPVKGLSKRDQQHELLSSGLEPAELFSPFNGLCPG